MGAAHKSYASPEELNMRRTGGMCPGSHGIRSLQFSLGCKCVNVRVTATDYVVLPVVS